MWTTLYRAIVMVAAGVIVVKGWQLYGPTPDEMKSMGARAAELVTTAWDHLPAGHADAASAAADPRLTPPPAERAAVAAPAALIEPAPLLAHSSVEAMPKADASAPPWNLETAEVAEPGTAPAANDDRLPLLYARLENLGASDGQLAEWGSGGQMYRFCCRAALAGAPAFARHFEAVATEPETAVEQVVAKVEAWRESERGGAGIP